jgi:hypothetical protein
VPAREWEILIWERAVAEVWRGERQLAKLRLDNEEVIIELCPNPQQSSWELPYQILMDLLKEARDKLLASPSKS